MSWADLTNKLRALVTDDTGAGGLLDSSSPLINAVYVDEAEINADEPYLVITWVSEDEYPVFTDGSEAIEYEFQVGIFTDAHVGLREHDNISERVRTVFRRASVQPTSWANRKIESLGRVQHQVVDGYRYSAHAFSVVLAKGA